MKLERLQQKSAETGTPSSVQTCSKMNKADLAKDKCFFCNKSAESEGLHNASTYDIDVNAWKCALELDDTVLLANLYLGT